PLHPVSIPPVGGDHAAPESASPSPETYDSPSRYGQCRIGAPPEQALPCLHKATASAVNREISEVDNPERSGQPVDVRAMSPPDHGTPHAPPAGAYRARIGCAEKADFHCIAQTPAAWSD